MSAAPLEVVLRVRRLALDEARRELGLCLAAEEAAAKARRAAEDAIRNEEQAASRLDTDDGAVEAFAAWLPRGRQVVEHAENALSRAEAATAQARARLASTRAAAEAAEKLLAAQLQEERLARAAKEQAVLDEIPRLRPRRPRPV